MSKVNAFALLSERHARPNDNEQTRTANRLHELELKLKLWIDPQLDGIRTALTRIRSDIPSKLDFRITSLEVTTQGLAIDKPEAIDHRLRLLEHATEKLSPITTEILIDRIKKLEVTTQGLAIDKLEAIDHRFRLLQQVVDEMRSHLRLPAL